MAVSTSDLSNSGHVPMILPDDGSGVIVSISVERGWAGIIP